MNKIWTVALFFSFFLVNAQSQVDLYQIIDSISPQKIEKSIQILEPGIRLAIPFLTPKELELPDVG